jgi:prepilin-type N-terminal cleavage/methylation domain-containing protein
MKLRVIGSDFANYFPGSINSEGYLIMKRPNRRLFILKEDGFTLLEMVLVIIIIGILAAVATVKYADFSESAKTTTCRANQQHLITAQRLYWVHEAVVNDNGHYAADIGDLAPYMANGVLPECPSEGTYSIVSDLEITCSLPQHQI